MSRHRDVRNLDYDAEYDDVYDGDIYGHSVDDNDFGVSPGSEQYLYQRDNDYGFAAYLPTSEDIKEEEDDDLDEDTSQQSSGRARRDSTTYDRPRLSSEDEARLGSVMDEIRNIVGDQFSDSELIRSAITNKYDCEATLNALLNRTSNKNTTQQTSLPQRQPRTNRQVSTGTAASGVERLRVHENTNAITSNRVAPPTASPGGRVVRGFDVQVTNNCDFNETNTVDNLSNEDGMPLPVTPRQNNTLKNDKESTPTPSANKAPTRARDKEVDIEKLYKEQRKSGKDLLNLVVVGHVDAGKSTLMGHLLYLQGNVAQRIMHKYEQESKKIGKQSFMYAWVLDDTDEERSRGITVDVAQRVFETPTKIITLLDAPGHKDFIPNMITGAARADVAVLVVDATTNAFEAGFESGGQTREHALLVRSLGVSQLAVAVNKIDTVDFSQSRFNEVMSSLRSFLKTAGFKDSDVMYIPCSGLTGENLIKAQAQELLAWYSGPTLLQAIDKLKVPVREYMKPTRLCISDVYKGQGSSMCLAGRLETGFVQTADRLLLMPCGEGINVKGVQTDNGESNYAFAGDHVTLNVAGADPNVIHVGDFVCDPAQPIPQVTRIQAKIVVFNIVVPLIKGSQIDFHYQSVSEPATIKKLVSQLHRTTGQVIKQKPRALVKNTSAIIQLEFSRPICLELYKEFKELGRFMLRTSGNTVAAGLVTQFLG